MKKILDFIDENELKIQSVFLILFELIFLIIAILAVVLGFVYTIKTYF